MSDIDVDYRASGFPKGLVNGHLSAANSDVRAGNNLDRHDGRWSGLNGWWRNVFGQLGTGGKPPRKTLQRALANIPLNPGVKAERLDTTLTSNLEALADRGEIGFRAPA